MRLGANVTAAWFRQDLAQVPKDRTLYECIAAERPSWGRGPIQGLLGAFGFSGDEVQRSTSQLSGGEQARMALALMTLAHANLLVLDEPTNHLDVESIESLEDALEEYEGSVVMVSHDRAFLRELATRVWAFDGTRIETFDGPFAEWEVHRAERAAARVDEGRKAKGEGKAKGGAAEQDERRRQDERSFARRAREPESLEAEVQTMEEKIQVLETGLADPSRYGGGGESVKRGRGGGERAGCAAVAARRRDGQVVGIRGEGLATRDSRLVTLLVAFVVAFGAALLFVAEPAAGKTILPWLGGTPAAWGTTLLFFQLALIIGYSLVDQALRRGGARGVAVVHTLVVVLAAIALGLEAPFAGSHAPAAATVGRTLALLTIEIGVPIAALALTAPALQVWAAALRGDRGVAGYALYAASNTGSLLGLLAYPFLVEPRFPLTSQWMSWRVGFWVFAGFVVVLWLVFGRQATGHGRTGTTSYGRLESDLSTRRPSRAVWVVPPCRGSRRSPRRDHGLSHPRPGANPAALGDSARALPGDLDRRLQRALSRSHRLGNGEPGSLRAGRRRGAAVAPRRAARRPPRSLGHDRGLPRAARRPGTKRSAESQLGRFYVWLAAGGAFGTLMVVVVGPALFPMPIEAPLAFALAVVLGRPTGTEWNRSGTIRFLALAAVGAALPWLTPLIRQPAIASLSIVAGSLAMLWRRWPARAGAVLVALTLAGVLLEVLSPKYRASSHSILGRFVVRSDSAGTELISGSTWHGFEPRTDQAARPDPSLYYTRLGPYGDLVRLIGARQTPWSFGVVGLGIGALACTAEPGTRLTFFEINPGVVRLARDTSLFRSLSVCAPGADVRLGDARLTLSDAPDRFDLLTLDAFNSDAIPTHLLTREAVALYRSRVTEGGVIAFHLSNRYLDLPLVVNALAADAGWAAVQTRMSPPAGAFPRGDSWQTWITMVAMARDRATLAPLVESGRWHWAGEPGPVWTDDWTPLAGALRLNRVNLLGL